MISPKFFMGMSLEVKIEANIFSSKSQKRLTWKPSETKSKQIAKKSPAPRLTTPL